MINLEVAQARHMQLLRKETMPTKKGISKFGTSAKEIEWISEIASSHSESSIEEKRELKVNSPKSFISLGSQNGNTSVTKSMPDEQISQRSNCEKSLNVIPQSEDKFVDVPLTKIEDAKGTQTTERWEVKQVPKTKMPKTRIVLKAKKSIAKQVSRVRY